MSVTFLSQGPLTRNVIYFAIKKKREEVKRGGEIGIPKRCIW